MCAWLSEAGCIHCLCERVDPSFLRLVIVEICSCPLTFSLDMVYLWSENLAEFCGRSREWEMRGRARVLSPHALKAGLRFFLSSLVLPHPLIFGRGTLRPSN